MSVTTSPGIAVVTADTSTNHAVPLTAERLHGWHRELFSSPPRHDITVGRWRDDSLGRMRVVSRSPTGQTVVHFEAPAAERLNDEMETFLEWFNQPEPEPDLIKAAIAHLWFVTIHPYDDGNGRIARAIADQALARCDGTDTRSYSMSTEILYQWEDYYQAVVKKVDFGYMTIVSHSSRRGQCRAAAPTVQGDSALESHQGTPS